MRIAGSEHGKHLDIVNKQGSLKQFEELCKTVFIKQEGLVKEEKIKRLYITDPNKRLKDEPGPIV